MPFKKNILILFTNRCNKVCGGCYQQCNNFPKEEIWDISVPELREAVDFCIENKDVILQGKLNPPCFGIIGGEPTVHPQYEELLDVLYSYQGRAQFRIYVNHLGETNEKNVIYRTDLKFEHGTTHNQTGFVPTLVSPTDLTGITDKNYHFQQAVRHCTLLECARLIFKGKIYQCQTAAMFDTLLKLNIGWPMERESLLRTKEESKDQLIDCCCRCGWSLDEKSRITKQSISGPTLISPHNSDLPLKVTKSSFPRFL
jgi:hypothetical protein